MSGDWGTNLVSGKTRTPLTLDKQKHSKTKGNLVKSFNKAKVGKALFRDIVCNNYLFMQILMKPLNKLH